MRLAALLFVLFAATHAHAQDVPASYAAVSDAHVFFDRGTEGVVLSQADGQGGWTPLGVAPIDFTLPPGPARLALSHGNHAPVPVPIALEIPDGARLVPHYESRQGLRELGVGLLLGTAVGVLIGVAIAIGGFTSSAIDIGIGGLVAGACVAVVGGATGIALATLDDLATLDVLVH